MTSAAEKWARLERIQGLLASNDVMTADELAYAVGVSRRTIMRDLNDLRDRGAPLEADHGRGGGVRLARGFGGGRVTLNQQEALDLLVALVVAEKLGSPLSAGTLASTRRKLALLFSPSDRDAIRSLRRRILVGEAVSERVAASVAPSKAGELAPVRAAFVERRLLLMEYRDNSGRRSSRSVEPHYLLLCTPAWYVLAWDHLRSAIRAFRIDRIVTSTALAQRFSVRPVGPFLAAADDQVETL